MIAVLILAAISPLVQTVGATFFFDPLVMLHWKADPGLRSFLAEHSTKSQAQVRVLIVFSYVPSSGTNSTTPRTRNAGNLHRPCGNYAFAAEPTPPNCFL